MRANPMSGPDAAALERVICRAHSQAQRVAVQGDGKTRCLVVLSWADAYALIGAAQELLDLRASVKSVSSRRS